MDMDEVLKLAVKHKASDIHLKVGLPPLLRVDGKLVALKDRGRLTSSDMKQFGSRLMNAQQRDQFKRRKDVDLSYGLTGTGRFRVNIFVQSGSVSMVLRTITDKVANLAELNFPESVQKLSAQRRGLILVTGTTGSGKSTTLAALIDKINRERTAHIVTIEDPIEYVIKDRKSVISQREVGPDTPGFASALRAALRQDPDAILVGEMRDEETIETALQAAETGHLVFSTLHTTDATETINRIITFFPPHHQKQVRLQLAGVLCAVISQRLVRTRTGKGRVPAVEVMIATSRIRELISDEERTREIRQAIAEGVTTYGMQTFDQSLMALVKRKMVSLKDALHECTNPDDFRLKPSGIDAASDGQWEEFGGPGAE